MPGTSIVRSAGAWEEVFLVILMERQSENSVGGEESLFDAIAVVDVDVNVEDSWMGPEEL
jgi:hypothetical protein